MDIKYNIIKKVLGIDEEIKYMVSHHILSYFSLIIISVIGIIILFFLYKFISVFFPTFASYLIGFLALLLYFYFILEFVDVYLDAVLVTENSIIIYKWYGMLKTTSDVLFLDAVESVYSDQSGLIDTLFNRGNIVIRRAGHENVFEEVYNPNDVANKINNIVNEYYKNRNNELEEEEEQDDFKLFVEAMAEVIKEYGMKKKS